MQTSEKQCSSKHEARSHIQEENILQQVRNGELLQCAARKYSCARSPDCSFVALAVAGDGTQARLSPLGFTLIQ